MDRSAIEALPMPATYGRHLARLFPPDRLLEGTGLTADDLRNPDLRITVRQALTYVRNTLTLASEADWYLAWASTLADHFHGPISAALASAPTLGAGLDVFLRFFPGRVPYLHLQGRDEGAMFAAEVCPLIDLGDATPLLVETPLLVLQQYLDTIYGVDLPRARLELAYPPTAHAGHYDRYFKCALRFGAPRHALVLPADWRALRNLDHVPSIWTHAVQQCESTIASSVERSTLGRVHDLLARAFAEPDRLRPLPTLADLAQRLHLAPRTLIRHLRRMGTTYQALCDDFLRARAAEHLANERVRIKEVAAALGFNNPANFGKAFRRWYGMAPGEFRARRR